MSVTISGDTIESTFRHPYWVISGKDLANRPTFPHIEKVPSTVTTPGRWVDAGDLQTGDLLLLRDGRHVPVENIRVAFVEQKVYNFSVAELKCYTVGSNQILVHNSDCDDIVNAPSKKISLGIDPHLDGFSLTHGADSWKVWAKDDPLNWKSAFNTQMNDLKNQVLFNLDGVDVWGGVTRGATPRAGATDWELAQIFQNRHWWDRIKWIKQGREIRNPFE